MKEIKEKIEHALEEIRPLLAMHAGNIELVDVSGGVVKVRLLGTCHGCPLSQLTLKSGVEELLRERVPGVETVEAIGE